MFELKCMECSRYVHLNSGVNDEFLIELTGQSDVLFDAEIYVECVCGNEITVEKE